MLRHARRIHGLASATRQIIFNLTRHNSYLLTSTCNLTTTGSGAGVGRLNHIAIAVPNLEEAANTYSQVLGASISTPKTLPEHGVRVVFVNLTNTKLELLEPLGDASPIANFLKKNPLGGMHHICLEVSDIQHAAYHVASSTSARLLSPNPKIGAHGHPVVFLHPKDMCGVLTELEEVNPQQ